MEAGESDIEDLTLEGLAFLRKLDRSRNDEAVRINSRRSAVVDAVVLREGTTREWFHGSQGVCGFESRPPPAQTANPTGLRWTDG